MSDFYQVLGLSFGASEDEIKRSYKKLAVKYHPDKTRDKSHHEKFLEIQKAYETLKSPEARKKYDREINVQPPSFSYSLYAQESSYYGFTRHFTSHFRAAAAASENMRREAEAASERMRARQREAQAAAEELRIRQRAAAAAAQQAQWEHEKRVREARERQHDEELRRQQEDARLREREQEMAEQSQRVEEELQRKREESQIRSEWEAARKRKDADRIRREMDDHEEERIIHAIFSEKEVSRHSPRGQRLVARIKERIFSARMDLKRAGIDDGDHKIVEMTVLLEFLPLHTRTRPEYNTSSYSEGTDSEHPIIVDDGPSHTPHHESEQEPRVYPETPTSENAGESDSATLAHSTELHDDNVEQGGLRMEDLDRLFEKPIRPRKDTRRSPKRSNTSTPGTRFPEGKSVPLPSGKRVKQGRFDFDDLKTTLNADIGNVDFSEILKSLPHGNNNDSVNISGSPRQRKASGDRSPKRRRYSEFTDGTSKAETVYTPVNKSPLKGHRPVITMLDLHASPAVHRYVPPPPPSTMVDSPAEWPFYVDAIKKYERAFFQYKKHIIQYQFERQQKDEEYYEEINLNIESFAVYEQCLRRDVVVMEEYTLAAGVYRHTMSEYRRRAQILQGVDI